MTYLLTLLFSGLTTVTVGPSVAPRAHSRHVVYEHTNGADIIHSQGTAYRGTEGMVRAGSGGNRGGDDGGGCGEGRRRKHFDMKKKEKKRVLPREPTSLYIHVNTE